MNYHAHLINSQGCNFDNAILSMSRIRAWATGRGGDYTCIVRDDNENIVAEWTYRNGRKVAE